MKTRLGFVSNSSSSSFVMVVEKKAYERKLEEVHPYVRAVVEAMDKKLDSFMGHDVILLGTWMNAGGGTNMNSDYLELIYDGEIPNDNYGDEMEPYTAFHEEFGGFAEDEFTCMALSD